MKTVTTIYFLILASCLSGQDILEQPDSLAVIKLEYEILDSNSLKAKDPLINTRKRNVVTYYSDEGIRLAYYIKDPDKWISVLLPYDERTNNFNFINLDKKGQPELIVKGDIRNYGTGCGTGLNWMIILNIDSIPTQIFKINFGCWDECFGDRNNEGEGGFYNSYERNILLSKKGILISPISEKIDDVNHCELTEIPAGLYIMKDGKIELKK